MVSPSRNRSGGMKSTRRSRPSKPGSSPFSRFHQRASSNGCAFVRPTDSAAANWRLPLPDGTGASCAIETSSVMSWFATARRPAGVNSNPRPSLRLRMYVTPSGDTASAASSMAFLPSGVSGLDAANPLSCQFAVSGAGTTPSAMSPTRTAPSASGDADASADSSPSLSLPSMSRVCGSSATSPSSPGAYEPSGSCRSVFGRDARAIWRSMPPLYDGVRGARNAEPARNGIFPLEFASSSWPVSKSYTSSFTMSCPSRSAVRSNFVVSPRPTMRSAKLTRS